MAGKIYYVNGEEIPISGGGGDTPIASDAVKNALLQLAEKVPCIDSHGDYYYNALYNALHFDDFVENFTRVGTPQIENGILTVSSGNYITTPESFNPGSDPWELTVKLKRPSIPGAREVLLLSNGIILESVWNSANIGIHLHSDNGTIVSGSDSKSVPAGEWRWLKVVFGGTAATGYDYGVSTDGVTFTYIAGLTEPFRDYRGRAYKTATPIKAGTLAFGPSDSIAQFDLMETEIKVNGETWWKPFVMPEGVS